MRKSSNPFTSIFAKRVFWLGLLHIFLFSACLFGQSKMSAPEVTALEAQVKQLAQTTETITSDFIQYKHLDFLSNDIESSGKLSYKAPDLVKWEYLNPFEYSVIFKDETLHIDNEGKKSNVNLEGNKLFEQMNQLITKSIKGDMFDTDQFTISYFKKNGDREVHFAPKNRAISDFISAFHIVFNDGGEVTTVTMVEPSDDYTKIIFSNRKTNKTLPNAVFAH